MEGLRGEMTIAELCRREGISQSLYYSLILSIYKPASEFEHRFQGEAGTARGAWDFVRQHLAQLPVGVHQDGVTETLSERQD